MTRPTPEEIEEIRRFRTKLRAWIAGAAIFVPPNDEESLDAIESLLAEIDALRGELAERDEMLHHVLTAHPGCRAGCDWADRVAEERRRLAGG